MRKSGIELAKKKTPENYAVHVEQEENAKSKKASSMLESMYATINMGFMIGYVYSSRVCV